MPSTTAAKYTTVVGLTAVRARKARVRLPRRGARGPRRAPRRCVRCCGAPSRRSGRRCPAARGRTRPATSRRTARAWSAIAAPPTTATAAYPPSTVATPSAAAEPVRIEVRAVRATSSAPTAPIGMAMAQPVTRPASTTSSTLGLWWAEGSRSATRKGPPGTASGLDRPPAGSWDGRPRRECRRFVQCHEVCLGSVADLSTLCRRSGVRCTAVYTVKHAAALTGIPADTLRMWERRYGVVAPIRTEGGYRLYDDAAIARLTAMRALVAAGWSARRAAEQVASGTTLGPIGATSRTEPAARSGDLDLLVRLAEDLDATTLSRLARRGVRAHRLRDVRRRLADARAAAPGPGLAPRRGLGGRRALRQRRRAPTAGRRPRRRTSPRRRAPGARRPRPWLPARARRAGLRGRAGPGRPRRRLRRRRPAARQLGRRGDDAATRRPS